MAAARPHPSRPDFPVSVALAALRRSSLAKGEAKWKQLTLLETVKRKKIQVEEADKQQIRIASSFHNNNKYLSDYCYKRPSGAVKCANISLRHPVASVSTQ